MAEAASAAVDDVPASVARAPLRGSLRVPAFCVVPEALFAGSPGGVPFRPFGFGRSSTSGGPRPHPQITTDLETSDLQVGGGDGCCSDCFRCNKRAFCRHKLVIATANSLKMI
jgi:hypothetical protein